MQTLSDNFVQIFQLDKSSIRGRSVRIGSVMDDIISAHNYPLPVAYMLAEVITLSVVLSSMFKYEGIFTLQLQSRGDITMIVSDVTSEGVVRGCASFKADSFKDGGKGHNSDTMEAFKLLGDGYLVFTVDQGEHTERYQGVVEITGNSLTESVLHYFIQSEQIKTGIKIAADIVDGKWRSGAIVLQNMPDEDGGVIPYVDDDGGEDDWRRSIILQASCTDEELLSKSLDVDTLLFRLFHEEGVRVFDDAIVLKKGCRCSENRVLNIIMSMTDADILHMIINGKISMNCEFCSKGYVFDEKTALDIIEKRSQGK